MKASFCYFDSNFFECFDNWVLELSVTGVIEKSTKSTLSDIRFSMAIILVLRLLCGLYFSLRNHISFISSFMVFISFLRLVMLSLHWVLFLRWILNSSCSMVLFILLTFFYIFGEFLKCMTFPHFVNVYFY